MLEDNTRQRLFNLEAKVKALVGTIDKLKEQIEALEIQTQSGRFEPQ